MKYGKHIGIVLTGAAIVVACGGDEGSTKVGGEAAGLSLIETSAIVEGDVCEAGGSMVLSGLDENGNGSLDDSEITGAYNICNGVDSVGSNGTEGAPGPDGSDGAPGPDGEDGTDVLSSTAAATLVACPEGGVVISTGRDDDGDGTLASAEVASTATVCNGEPGPDNCPPVIRVTTIDPAATCVAGGLEIATGSDTGLIIGAGGGGGAPNATACDGILTEGEESDTTVICNGETGPNGPIGIPGDDGDPGPDGGPGDDGDDGFNFLMEVGPAGSNCADGGYAIQSGYDANDNGVLDAGDDIDTIYHCYTTPVPPAKDCMAHLLNGNNTSGTYKIDPDGFGGGAPFDVYCDQTTDGGGWTRCAQIDETSNPNICVDEGASYLDATSLTNGSFCQHFYENAGADNLMVHNLTAGDATNGYNDRVIIDWTADPILAVGDYSNAESVSCKHLNAGDGVQSYYASCTYASHGGSPWQSAAWSFTANGLANGYGGNADRRVLLGPTFDCSAGTGWWYNFAGGFNTNSTSNSWQTQTNIGDVYVRPNLPTSCLEAQTMGYATDGVYRIDPDGSRGVAPAFDVFCDMTTNGGGWTLIAKINAGDYTGTHTAQQYTDLLTSRTNDVNPAQLLNGAVPANGVMAFLNQQKTNALHAALWVNGVRNAALRIQMSGNLGYAPNNTTWFQQKLGTTAGFNLWEAIRAPQAWGTVSGGSVVTRGVNYAVTNSAASYNPTTNVVTSTATGNLNYWDLGVNISHSVDGATLVGRHFGLLTDSHGPWEWVLTSNPGDGRFRNDSGSSMDSVIWIR